MDDLDYLEDQEIKTHKEIVRMLQELDEYEKLSEHPIHIEHVEPEPEFIEVTELEYHPASYHEQDPGKQPTDEHEVQKKEKNKLLSLPVQKRRKVPKALVQTSRIRRFLFERKKHKPHDVVISKRTPGKRRLFRTSITSPAPRSTFTLRLDSEGNLLGFFSHPSKIKKESPEKKQKHRFFKRKKIAKEKEPKTSEPAKGFKAKLTKIIPHRKSKEKTEEKTGIASKLKGLVPRRKKSKEVKE